MTVFRCAACGTAITPDLTELPAVPDVRYTWEDRDPETRRLPPTVPRGHYAIDPYPWGPPYVVQADQENPLPAHPRWLEYLDDEGFLISAGTADFVVLHPADAPALEPLPGGEGTSGCCGPMGADGLNRACPCGAPLATLVAACSGPYELHLDPDRTRY